jgi:hypothetical protein
MRIDFLMRIWYLAKKKYTGLTPTVLATAYAERGVTGRTPPAGIHTSTTVLSYYPARGLTPASGAPTWRLGSL